jgi:hypothetical protein
MRQITLLIAPLFVMPLVMPQPCIAQNFEGYPKTAKFAQGTRDTVAECNLVYEQYKFFEWDAGNAITAPVGSDEWATQTAQLNEYIEARRSGRTPKKSIPELDKPYEIFHKCVMDANSSIPNLYKAALPELKKKPTAIQKAKALLVLWLTMIGQPKPSAKELFKATEALAVELI